MKKLYYLIILTVILGLVLTGCTLLSNIGQTPTSEQSGITYLTKGPLSDDLVDLVGLWHFDEGSGVDTVADSSGNGNTGTVVGATTGVIGQFGNALSFDGIDDHVDCGDISTANWVNLTTEAWVYWDGTVRQGYAGVYCKAYGNDIGRLLINGAGVILVQNGNGNFFSDNIGDVPVNEWCHIAYVYDQVAGKEYIYVNGDQKGEQNRTGDITQNSNNFCIGYGWMGPDHYIFSGLIDEVRIWDGALTAKQIEDSFNHGIVIQKGMSQEEAVLGDHVTVTLEVVTAPESVFITDTLPDELRYIPDTFEVDGVLVDPTVVGQTISYTLDEPCAHTIIFGAQVTSAEADDNTVINEATAGGASALAELIINPYDGFEKEVEIKSEDTVDGVVEVNELVQWDMTITVPNNFAWLISDATLSDRLGAELGMAGDDVDNNLTGGEDEGVVGDLASGYNNIPGGAALIIKTKGKANKVQFKITGITIPVSSSSVNFMLGIFTDKNPAGKQSYTSDGTYELNSGAVLKFIDPDPEGPGFQLSAHTLPIALTVVEVTEP